MGCGAGRDRQGRDGGGEREQIKQEGVGTEICLRLRLKLRLAGWLLQSMITGHARGLQVWIFACKATAVTSWPQELQHMDALQVYFAKAYRVVAQVGPKLLLLEPQQDVFGQNVCNQLYEQQRIGPS